MRLDERDQPLVAEFLARLVQGFADAVAEQHDKVARLQRERFLGERRLLELAIISLDIHPPQA